MELETFKHQVCLRKIGYEMHYHWGQTTAKTECDNFEYRTSWKKSSANLTVVGWGNNRVVYKASSKSVKPKIYVWCFNKIGRSIFKNNNQISSTVTTRTQAFLTEWTGTFPSQWLVSEWKNGGVSACLNGWSYSSECVGVIILTKMKAMIHRLS